MRVEILGRRTGRHFKSAGLRQKYERGEISHMQATHPVTITRVQEVGAGLYGRVSNPPRQARTPDFFPTPLWAVRPLLTDMMRTRKAERK